MLAEINWDNVNALSELENINSNVVRIAGLCAYSTSSGNIYSYLTSDDDMVENTTYTIWLN